MTDAGTAGVMLDFSDRLGALALSLLSDKSLSVDMIRLEVIVVVGRKGMPNHGPLG